LLRELHQSFYDSDEAVHGNECEYESDDYAHCILLDWGSIIVRVNPAKEKKRKYVFIVFSIGLGVSLVCWVLVGLLFY